MDVYRGYGFSAVKLALIVGAGRVAALRLGRSERPRLFVLPIEQWRDEVAAVYGPNDAGTKRLKTSTTAPNLTEDNMMKVLVDQVDAGWQPAGGTIFILTLEGEDVAYLVPANAYWRALVEGER